MDGNPEVHAETDDCVDCIDCIAFKLLLQEIINTGDPDLFAVVEDLIGYLGGNENPDSTLHSRCVLAIADAARWLPTASEQRILERAIAVDVDPDVIDAFCEMHGLTRGSEDGNGPAQAVEPVVAPAAAAVPAVLPDDDDCANCPACRIRALIYRELLKVRFPLILPIAQAVLAELSPEVLEAFGSPDGALNSLLLTAAEEFNRTAEAGCSGEGLAMLGLRAADVHLDDCEIAKLQKIVKALAAASGRLEHR